MFIIGYGGDTTTFWMSSDYTLGEVCYCDMEKRFNEFTVIMEEQTKACEKMKKVSELLQCETQAHG